MALKKMVFDWQLENLTKENVMNNLFRGLLAGGAAAKWGGGCLGTILVFLLVWFALGQCS
jgi:hypothetical protein